MSYLIKKGVLFFCALLVVTSLFAQDTTSIKKKKQWAVKVGSPVFVPTMDNYTYKYSQGTADIYEYNYTLKPNLKCGINIDLLYFTTFYTNRFSELLLGYGMGYKQSVGQVVYLGQHGGGNSANYYAGIGSYLFKQHYIQPQLNLWYKYNFKNNKVAFVSGVGLAADYLLKTNIDSHFENYNGASRVFNQNSKYSYSSYNIWNNQLNRYSIQYFLNYEIGYSFLIKNKWQILPTVKTSVLNINNIINKKMDDMSSIEKAKYYYAKEVVFGIVLSYK